MKIYFFLLSVFFITTSSYAEVLYYQANGAGMHLMDATVQYHIKEQKYDTNLKTQTKGLLSFLVDSESVFQSSGRVDKEKMKVLTSSSINKKGKREKKRVLDFSDKQDHLDYSSVFLHRLFTVSENSQDYLVYDGKRIMNISFHYEGKVNGADLGMNLYPTLVYYTVSVDILSGKKKGWFFNRMKDKKNSPLHLYFTPMNPKTRMRKLAYAAFDTTLFGQITIREKEEK